VKGIVRLQSSSPSSRPYETHILNYAFGRYELVDFPSLDNNEDLAGVSLRLTMMGERGEVAIRARRFADSLEATVEG
jgi:hypothetical protein